MSRFRVLVPVVVLAGLICPAHALAQRSGPIPFSEEAVDKAIERGVNYIWSKYKKTGHTRWGNPWEESWYRPDGKHNEKHNIFGGYTALAVYTLLTCDESYQGERMKHAINWLVKNPTKGTYPLALRTQVWAKLPANLGRALLAKESMKLVRSISQPAKGEPLVANKFRRWGTYGYVSSGRPGIGGDHSNTQFGVLGVWAAARKNIEIPQGYWELVFKHWVASQNGDGGWGYASTPGRNNDTGAMRTKATMVPAGLASLFIAIDNIFAAEYVRCGKKFEVPAIEKGLAWLEKNFKIPPGRVDHYNLYGIERVGLASGYKYFGKKDWYKLAATKLINSQSGHGGFGYGLADTCFALLFLARGRSPVMFNRLKYDGDWNNRPRALANLTRWASEDFERESNWQIIDLKAPVGEWHDSQMLLITGAKKPKFTDADVAKLRKFVQQGGTILSVAECLPRGKYFDTGMREVYGKMFPQYELTLLKGEHPVYTVRFQLKRPTKIWTVSNGVRVLAFHTTTDLLLAWQTNKHITAAEKFRLAGNISFYANERSRGRPRGASLWPAARPFPPLRAVRVARVKYAGNWDPEPLAWRRFALLMGQKHKTNVTISPVTCAELDPKKWPVAAVTGTGRLGLDRVETNALKAYVEGGGTLIIDAAGGSKSFTDSARALLAELWGADALRPVTGGEGVYNLPGMVIKSVKYRKAIVGAGETSRIKCIDVGKRIGVFFSREDLTVGLLGSPVYGCVGYTPKTALALMRNMVLYGSGAGKRAKAPAGG